MKMVLRDRIYLKFTGEVASKKNSRVFNRERRVLLTSKRFRAWERVARASLQEQISELPDEKKEALPLDEKRHVSICFQFTHEDRHRRDSDNAVSSVLDLLVDGGVLTDDCWEIAGNYMVTSRLAREAACYIEIEFEREVECDLMTGNRA